jgi:hypothetical protein
MTTPTCDAPADPDAAFGGPRCGKLAAYKCPFGYRCSGCADRFRAMALNPKTVVNLISGRPRTEVEISNLLIPIH